MYNYSDEHIFIVGAHINNNDVKKSKLIRCIESLRQFNIPILLSTHHEIPDDIKEIVDYHINDNKNEILEFERFAEFRLDNIRWVETELYYINNSYTFQHDFAALTIIKNAVIFAKELGKSKIHYIDYDCVIDAKQFSQTFMIDIENYDVSIAFVFSMKMWLAEKIFIDNVTTLENHFNLPDWRFEDFLMNRIKEYTNSYKISEYIDNNKLINTEAAWSRAGIDRNGAYFDIYTCVDSYRNLYISLVSNVKTISTPTSGSIFNNRNTKDEYLIEIKYETFSEFHYLSFGEYDLVKVGKYNKGSKVIIKYVGVNVFEETLTSDFLPYLKRNNLTFKN